MAAQQALKKANVKNLLERLSMPGKPVQLISFGFKHGKPPKADVRVDVRFVANPYYVKELSRKSGRHPLVKKFLLAQDSVCALVERLASRCLRAAIKKKAGPFCMAIGCTGGRHRSVVISESVAKKLKNEGYQVQVTHRDIQKF